VSSARILAVDDEQSTAQALAEMLELWGHKVETAGDGTDALKKAAEFRPDVVLSDLAMPETDGLWLLRALKDDLPDCPVIFLTGRATIDAAVAAIREGAYDFIEKPVDPARLKVCIDRALEKKETLREVQVLRRKLKQMGATDFIGASSAMRRVFELIEKVAPAKASVAITGESGTGKEMVARSIHNLSPRRDKPFIAINCASIPATLMESELLGHERGAFTGADQRRPGVFELAHGGTLFLDEVGEIPVELQAKLLRVLEEGRLRRLGGKTEIEVDVRVLCATNRDLEAEVRAGRFREDLYYRLNVFQIAAAAAGGARTCRCWSALRGEVQPGLGQARDRVPGGDGAAPGVRLAGQHPRAEERGGARSHPLRRRAHHRDYLPPDMAGKVPSGTSSGSPTGSPERGGEEYILGSLQRNANNKARTAEMLGVSEKTLYNKLNRYSAEARAAAAAAEADGPSQPPLTQPASPQNR
jgi:DNA-binding NtrC family response regulator